MKCLSCNAEYNNELSWRYESQDGWASLLSLQSKLSQYSKCDIPIQACIQECGGEDSFSIMCHDCFIIKDIIE